MVKKNGKLYEQMDDLGGKPTIFGNTHISLENQGNPPKNKVDIFVPTPYVIEQPSRELIFKRLGAHLLRTDTLSP